MYEPSLFYAILLFTSALVSAITAGFLWSRRKVPGAVPLFCYTLTLIVWSLTYAVYWLSTTPEARLFWLDATYFGVVLSPITFFIFTLYYTHREHWINRYTLALLALHPLITLLLLLWTDPLHGLFYAGLRTPDSSTIFNGGPWFWIHVIYSYGLLAVCYLMLLQAFRRAQKPYRHQTGIILFAVTLPWLSNVVSFANLNPWPQLDLTPVVFTLSGLIITVALIYRQLFDLMPVARGKVIETMREPVFVIDHRQRIVDINPSARLLLNQMRRTPNEGFVGSSLHILVPEWAHWLITDDDQFEVEIDAGDSVRWFEKLISPLIDERGERLGTVVVLNDITRRKLDQQRAFELALEKERHRLLANFIQTASHEFRTPLTVIQSSAQLMTRTEDPEKRAQRGGKIEEYVRRIDRLVDMLLMTARLEAVDTLTQKPVDLNAIADAICDRCIEQGERGGGPAVRIEMADDLPTVMGDVDYLTEAVAQIFDNACRFTPDDGVVTVTTGSDDEQRVWLEIRDSGPGIAEADLPHIFQTFWRGDKAHSTPGFGLGMSIAQKIVELHNGTIEIESQPNHGSSFRIKLPANAV